MLMKSAVMTTALLCVAASSYAGGRDDSVWINQEIAQAVKSGFKSLSLGAETYVLQNPVVIPNGAKNFTLTGAGPTKTVFTSPNVALQEQLLVGSVPVLHNNWVLTNRTNYAVSPVEQGAETITVSNPKQVLPNHYYVLWDDHVEWANNSNQTCVMNHAEIVRFSKVSSSGVATLDEPASRDYDSSAKIADVDSIMCVNVGISGIGFNGAVTGSNTPCQSFVQVGLADGVQVDNVTGTNFLYTALDFVNTRNVVVNNANLSGAAATGPGEGYGITFSRCRYASGTNSVTSGLRHGFIFHAGTTDSSFVNCTSTGGGFDAHGMDERRLSVTNCSTDGTVQFGNQAWPEGDVDCVVSGGSFGGGINLCAYADYVTASKASFGGFNLWSDLAGVTNPPADQYADHITFTDCAFTSPHNVIGDTARLGTATFNSCSFEATNVPWGNVCVINDMAGTMVFNNCQFQLDSGRSGDVPLQINTTAQFSLTLNGCTITAEGGGPASTQFAKGFAGSANLVKSTFISIKGKNPSFISNFSKVNISTSTDKAESK